MRSFLPLKKDRIKFARYIVGFNNSKRFSHDNVHWAPSPKKEIPTVVIKMGRVVSVSGDVRIIDQDYRK